MKLRTIAQPFLGTALACALACGAPVGEPLVSTPVARSAASGEVLAQRADEVGDVAAAPDTFAAGPQGVAAVVSAAQLGNPEAPPVAQAAPNGQLTSIAYKTWIWDTPNTGGKYLGFMRIGQRLALRSSEKVIGQGCARGFWAVEPRGYVCQDRTVSRANDTPFLRANAHTLPMAGAFPYHYALSNGAPMYARIPSRDEQRRLEAQFGKAGVWIPMPPFSAGHEHLAVNAAIAPEHQLPPFLRNGMGARGKPLVLFKRALPHGSMMAYTRSFEVDGRTYLLSADLTVVPADRVRKFRRSRFAGVKLGAKTQLPLAWFRKEPRPRYRLVQGQMTRTNEQFAVRTHASLSGVQHTSKGELFHEVGAAGSGVFAAASDATIVEHYGKRPFGVKPGEKWIMVSILKGTLVAYDDMTPVFTTLVSPGQGGLPRKGGDSVKDSTTPLGSYRITFKDVAATMSPEMGANRSFWIADVPHTQYFNAPFALHGAYWHEKFGEPMSAGCVNLSPLDARWLFGWSDPQVPPGWQGAAGIKANGATTAVIIVR